MINLNIRNISMKLLIYWIIKYVKSYIDFIFFKIKISLSIKKFTFTSKLKNKIELYEFRL
jgi:hypothetical protein